MSYGREISCTDALRTGRYVTGARLVAEACYRRLTTPRGALRGGDDEANYGLDLTAYVGKGNPNAIVASLPGLIRSELEKDERIESVEVTVLSAQVGAGTSLTITVNAETGAGPFELRLGVSDVTASLLGIST